MTTAQATADVFLTAFRALPRRVRDEVVLHIVQDASLREDFIDLAIAENRLKEPTRPLKQFLSDLKLKTKRAL